jgi:uncharacterized delta-60 repeat protein
VAIQGNGKIVLAGFARTAGRKAFALARYHVDGSLDRSFGSGGRVVTAFDGGAAQANDVAIAPGGRIVVAGTVTRGNRGAASRRSDFAVARYRRDGSLDRRFSRNGKLTVDFRGQDGAQAVAVTRRGKIVAAGYTISGGDGDFALARLRPNGALDRRFSRNGKRTTNFRGGGRRHRNDIASAVALRHNGKIVVAGESGGGGDSTDFAFAQYRRNGSLDRRFAGDGKLTPGIGGFAGARDVAVRRDGRIVALGSPIGGFMLARLDPRGRLDGSFGGDGTVQTDFGSGVTEAYGVALQRDCIVAVGQSEAGENPFGNFLVARYRGDGSLDGSFGSGGWTTTAFSDVAGARAVALAPGGTIVAAGFAGNDSTARSRFALVRYDADGALDGSLAGDGTVTTAFRRRDMKRAASAR